MKKRAYLLVLLVAGTQIGSYAMDDELKLIDSDDAREIEKSRDTTARADAIMKRGSDMLRRAESPKKVGSPKLKMSPVGVKSPVITDGSGASSSTTTTKEFRPVTPSVQVLHSSSPLTLGRKSKTHRESPIDKLQKLYCPSNIISGPEDKDRDKAIWLLEDMADGLVSKPIPDVQDKDWSPDRSSYDAYIATLKANEIIRRGSCSPTSK